jgi:hypothetical protein
MVITREPVSPTAQLPHISGLLLHAVGQRQKCDSQEILQSAPLRPRQRGRPSISNARQIPLRRRSPLGSCRQLSADAQLQDVRDRTDPQRRNRPGSSARHGTHGTSAIPGCSCARCRANAKLCRHRTRSAQGAASGFPPRCVSGFSGIAIYAGQSFRERPVILA